MFQKLNRYKYHIKQKKKTTHTNIEEIKLKNKKSKFKANSEL